MSEFLAGLLAGTVTTAVVVLAGWGVLSFLDNEHVGYVTRWRVPDASVYHGVNRPLYDTKHCLRRSEAASLGGSLRRAGSESGLARFVPSGPDPGMVFLRPSGSRCFMWYLALSDVG